MRDPEANNLLLFISPECICNVHDQSGTHRCFVEKALFLDWHAG